MENLILLGTVHRDPDGKRRLARLLEDLRPRVISLEVSPASIRIRWDQGWDWIRLFKEQLTTLRDQTGLGAADLMERATLRGVYEYLRFPYEYRAAVEYARRTDRPLFLLDDSDLAVSYLNRVEDEILTLDNMRLLAEAGQGRSLEREVRDEYQRAEKRIFGPGPQPDFSPPDPESWAARENSLSQKLRLLHSGLKRRTGQSLKGQLFIEGLLIPSDAAGFIPETVELPEDGLHLYIGGWEHLMEDHDGQALYNRLKDLDPERRLLARPI